MILCPWCGTSTTTFQTPCPRCGGPIPEPAKPAPASPVTLNRAKEEVVDLPPAPPRAISDSYRWKLMRADPWCQGAFIFVLLGAFFGVLGLVLTVAVVTAFVGIPFLGLGVLFLGGGGYVLYRRDQETTKRLDILRRGEAVIGQVSEARTNTSVEVNGRNPVTIRYRFEAGGREYQGEVTTLNSSEYQFPSGKSTCILYLPEAPEYSSMYPHP